MSEKLNLPTVKIKEAQDFLQSLSGLAIDLPSKDIEALFENVSTAINNPENFFLSHADNFNQRGINKPSADLYKIVILDRLIELGAMAEIDWNEEVDTIIWNIGRISGESKIEANIAKTENTETALAKIANELKGTGKILLQWKTDSDSYCLIAVKVDSAENIIKKAANLGVELKQKLG